MDKVYIEEVGGRIGIDRETTIGIFLGLAGEVWAGELLPEEGPPIAVAGPRTKAPPWHRVAFDRTWFQKRGKLPTSGPS